MNIKLIREKWIKFYKRGFVTGLMVLSFICLIDQILQTPFFFNKLDSSNYMLTLSFIIFIFIFFNYTKLLINYNIYSKRSLIALSKAISKPSSLPGFATQ